MKRVQFTLAAALLCSLMILMQLSEVAAQGGGKVPCETAISDGWVEGEDCFLLWKDEPDREKAIKDYTKKFTKKACELAFGATDVVSCDQVPENLGLGCTPDGAPMDVPCQSGGRIVFESTNGENFRIKCETHLQSTGKSKDDAEQECSDAWNTSRRTRIGVTYVCIEFFAKHLEIQRCHRELPARKDPAGGEDS